jgi:hypothetical protein
MSSHFDVGQDLSSAAAQLESYLHGQHPCAKIARQAATLSITYNASAGACAFHGRNVSGQQTINVLRNADNEVSVHHAWLDLSDGTLSISGSIEVTWSRTSGSRRVVHTLSFEVLSGSHAGEHRESRSDSTQVTTAESVRINGLRQWSSEQGRYALDMFAIEQRFTDSIPQAGAYELTIPTTEALSLAFGRIDADTIRVTVQGAQETLFFSVTSDGSIQP